jgi:predicted transcriptional regulator
MKINEIMTKSMVLANANDSLRDTAQMMRDNDIGALPVMSDSALKGIITDRDIVIRAVAEGLNPSDTPVSRVMSSQVLTCDADDDVRDAISLMKEKKVRRLVILDRSGNPAGMLSLGDIAAHENIKLAAETLKKVSEPVHS